MEQPPLTQPAPDSPAREEDAAVQLEAILTEALHLCMGLPHQQAFERAQQLTAHLRQAHGGNKFYIPAPNRAQRNAAIRAALRQLSASEVADRFDLSVRTVRYIAAGGAISS